MEENFPSMFHAHQLASVFMFGGFPLGGAYSVQLIASSFSRCLSKNKKTSFSLLSIGIKASKSPMAPTDCRSPTLS